MRVCVARIEHTACTCPHASAHRSQTCQPETGRAGRANVRSRMRKGGFATPLSPTPELQESERCVAKQLTLTAEASACVSCARTIMIMMAEPQRLRHVGEAQKESDDHGAAPQKSRAERRRGGQTTERKRGGGEEDYRQQQRDRDHATSTDSAAHLLRPILSNRT
eukprot:1373682-Rhodomonas_salina.1